MALVHKIVQGKSADAMIYEYERLIESGTLHMEKPPHQNTLTEWMNDERLTPILHEFLRITSLPFRAREIAAIIDSSKVSQLRNAHYQSVEYDGDERPGADWMKCHALVGVETMVVMAVAFSGSVNKGTHDINFVKPLMTEALKTFPLQFMLGDKAYLKEDILTWLWDQSIKAVIPVKKRWFRDEKKAYHESVMELVKWFDQDNGRIFHQFYRLRPKIEAFFSLLKRSNQEHCWSRGRRSNTARNAETPCTAWINETLCKFIYMNLRTTHTLEKETGYKIDYSYPERHFCPPSDPLILRAA